MSTPPTPAASALPRKSLWETILTSTPIVLTVVATLLAGFSSGEMTQAMYHRSLAAQNQSKAGDQWNFFQAKRIRGTTLETTVDLLQSLSEPGPVSPEALQAAAGRLWEELHRAEKETNRLLEALGPAPAFLGPADDRLRRAAAQLLLAVQAKATAAEQARAQVAEVLADRAVQDAFTYLSASKVPAASTVRIDDPTIRGALLALQARRPDGEIEAMLASLPEDALHQAVRAAEANILAVEEADRPVSRELGRIDQLVRDQVALARSWQRAVRDVDAALAGLSPAENRASAELSAAAAALRANAATVKTAADELNNDFKAARHAYTARRYRNEANYNQEAAGLYEIQVRQSSLTSERHRARSKHFFYGMLVAQAGVTTATLSLAVRRKSVLWGLASLAGAAAVAVGVYVYLYM
jgi:hypothetical protein